MATRATKPAGEAAMGLDGNSKPPRRRPKTTADSKRLAGVDPFRPAYEAATDLIMTALAGQRVSQALAQKVQPLRPRPVGFELDLARRLDGVRTAEQFRANFSDSELRDLADSLQRSLAEKSRAILDGIGNHAHDRAQRETHRSLAAQLPGLVKLSSPRGEEGGGLLPPGSDEIDNPASYELVYASRRDPSKAATKRVRAAIATRLGVDERTVRRWEHEEGPDERIFVTRADLARDRLHNK